MLIFHDTIPLLTVGIYEESGPSVVTDETDELLGTRTETQSSYPGGMLLHLVLVAVRDTGTATQRAIPAELGVWQLPAWVPETHPTLKPGTGTLRLTPETGALHGMAALLHVGKPVLERQPDKAPGRRGSHCCV